MRAMWATIRLVVVLPFVPVTATTGMAGVMVVGRLPGSAAATSLAAALTAASTSGVTWSRELRIAPTACGRNSTT